jgi:hypothetical protein
MRKNAPTPERDIARLWGKVDKKGEDECWIWLGSHVGNGYGHFMVNNKFVYVHRFSYELSNGEIPKDMYIDHLCHTRDCVNPKHMRLATHAENCHNMNIKVANKCGLKGVYFHGSSKNRPWMAQIVVGNKHIYLGLFPTKEEAHHAYCDAAIKYHGEFANFG